MGMSLAVYRVNAETGERTTVRSRYHVRTAALPTPFSTVLPACRCARCEERERAGGYRDTSGTVQTR